MTTTATTADVQIELRPYQRDALTAIEAAALRGVLRQEFCFGIASDTARDAQLLHLVREGARWRENAPSPKQEALARRLGVQIQPWWRSGELSDAITAVTGEWYD